MYIGNVGWNVCDSSIHLETIFPRVVRAPSGFRRMRNQENLAVAVDEKRLIVTDFTNSKGLSLPEEDILMFHIHYIEVKRQLVTERNSEVEFD